MQNFRALGAPPPHTHWPPAAGGSAPRPQKQPPPLRISGYAPARYRCILSQLTRVGLVWLIVSLTKCILTVFVGSYHIPGSYTTKENKVNFTICLISRQLPNSFDTISSRNFKRKLSPQIQRSAGNCKKISSGDKLFNCFCFRNHGTLKTADLV